MAESYVPFNEMYRKMIKNQVYAEYVYICSHRGELNPLSIVMEQESMLSSLAEWADCCL